MNFAGESAIQSFKAQLVGERLQFVHIAWLADKVQFFLAIARHYVEMEVLDRLSRGFSIVLQNIETIARKRTLQMRGHLLYALYHGGENVIRSIGNTLAVFARYYQRMSLRKRIYVKIGYCDIILVNTE